MSTQHPDNVLPPPFSANEILQGDDEIKEAFFAYSELNCHEQLWDAEGKEADNFVVKKLLSRYEQFFRAHPLGSDVILSVRVPNPAIEKGDAKILLEALYSITRSYDIARLFYGEKAPAPIIEVFVPMTSSAQDVLRVRKYYEEFIIKEQEREIAPGVRIKDWLGPFGPEKIRVTPLVEDKESLLRAHEIAQELITTTKPELLRFWLARSDPALNYGNPATVLLLKIALQRLHAVEQKSGVPILPILGLGSAPFRGNFRPNNADTILAGYPSVQTFTLQSSFKYDHPLAEVKEAVRHVNEFKRAAPRVVDERALLPIIEKLERAYQEEVALLAPLINKVASAVPSRRLRKLHVGLFGYSREQTGVSLPRAITFTAALYSIGLPPELLSLSVLSDEEFAQLQHAWKNFESDFKDAAQYANPKTFGILPPLVRERVEKTLARWPVHYDTAHAALTEKIVLHLDDPAVIRPLIVDAAKIRTFLG